MLDGVRVLDLSGEPGFLAGKILGDLGADVIKLEPPGGHPGRRGPFLGGTPDPERSLPWLALNTSKRGVTLDLEAPKGGALFRRLARGADVVIETERPGRLSQLGVGYDVLRRENPRIVWCALTPFGQTGPYARFGAHDLVVTAMGGNPALTGDPDRPPVRCSMPSSYYHGGADAALGIAMALYAREDTGKGQFVDVSLQESQTVTLMTGPSQLALSGRLRSRGGARLGNTREIWRTRDGWVTFGLRSGPARTPNLVATVQYMDECGMAPDWLRDYDWKGYNHNLLSEDEARRLEEAFGAFFASKSMRELYTEALARRIMLAPCNNAREILAQEQLRFRELFVTLEYPELGARIEHPDFFAKTPDRAVRLHRRAPRIGEHNAEVYTEAGVSADELSELAAEGVV